MGYPKEVFDKAWETMEKRRRESREEGDRRKDEVYARIPGIRDIDRELAGTGVRLSRLVLSEPGQAGEFVARLRDEVGRLQLRRRELLESAGFPADYLQEIHHCPHCLDEGYVGSDRCGCMVALLRQIAFKSLTSGAPVTKYRFDNFSLELYPETAVDKTGILPRKRMGEILGLCKDFVGRFSPASPSLLMLGPTGLGKTHLSLAIAGAVVDKGFGVVYMSVQKLMDKLEAARFSRDSETRDQYADTIQSLLDCDLLVLDDLGTEFVTQFTNSVLYNIVNSRGLEEKPSIISTNLETSGIEEKYGQRILSRLVCGYTILNFVGRDIRFIQKAGLSQDAQRGRGV